MTPSSQASSDQVAGSSRRCTATTKTGRRCTANPLAGDDRCWFHSNDPDVVLRRKEAIVRGGSWPKSPQTLDISEVLAEGADVLKDPEALRSLLAGVAKGVVEGRVDKRILNSLVFASRELVKLYELTDLEKRLSRVERDLGIEEN
jgi:hypothetical protein